MTRSVYEGYVRFPVLPTDPEHEARIDALINAEIRKSREERAPAKLSDAISDAIAASVAETLLPPPLPCVRDHVVELEGRSPLYLFGWDEEGGFRCGEDRRKAEHFTRAEAEYRAAKMGEGWRSRRVT